jgi:hypothetical protein
MNTQARESRLSAAKSNGKGQTYWKAFVKRHWLFGHKALDELKILIRLAGPKNGAVNGRSVPQTSSLRLKRV